tara:strand:+ start:853 stop:1809 length:957 start_codon:yes stop_codon:yes gene_type:complete
MNKSMSKKIQKSRKLKKKLKKFKKTKKIYTGGSYVEKIPQAKHWVHEGKICYNLDVMFSCKQISPIPNKILPNKNEKQQLKRMFKNCYMDPLTDSLSLGINPKITTKSLLGRFENHTNGIKTYFCCLHENSSIYAFCFCSLYPKPDHPDHMWGYIDTVCTSKNQRNQHCCERLMEEVVNKFGEYHLELHVRTDKYEGKGLPPNFAASHCYEKLGFRFFKTMCVLENDGLNCTMVRPPLGVMSQDLWDNTISCNEAFNGKKSQKLKVAIINNIPVMVFLLREVANKKISAYANLGNNWIIKDIDTNSVELHDLPPYYYL